MKKTWFFRTIHKFEFLLCVMTSIHVLPGMFLTPISIFQVFLKQTDMDKEQEMNIALFFCDQLSTDRQLEYIYIDRISRKEKVTETSFFSLSIQGLIYHILYTLLLNIIPFYLKLIFCLDIIYYFWSGIHLSPWTFLKCFDSWVSLKFSHVKYPPKWTNRKFCETLSGYVWWVISINIKG